MNIVNLTPHKVVLISEEGNRKEYFPSGRVARLRMHDIRADIIDGFPVYKGLPMEVIELPEEKEDTFYIVSLAVLQHCKDRYDLIAPDTSRAVRDEDGNIIGVRGWRIV